MMHAGERCTITARCTGAQSYCPASHLFSGFPCTLQQEYMLLQECKCYTDYSVAA